MGKVKNILYHGDINVYAIREYSSRMNNYEQIVKAISSFNTTLDIRNYVKFVRMYEILINAETNLEAMIDMLYKARRAIHDIEEKFHPYGKNSPYITKRQYIESTIKYIESAISNADEIHSKASCVVRHNGMLIYDKTHIAIDELMASGDHTKENVDKINNTLMVLINNGYINNFSIVHLNIYLKLISKIVTIAGTYEHDYYVHVKDIIITKISTDENPLFISMDERPEEFMHVLYQHLK